MSEYEIISILINKYTCIHELYYIHLLEFCWREHYLKVRQQIFVAKLCRSYLWAVIVKIEL